MRRLLSWVLNVAYAGAGLVFLPVVVYRLIFAGRYRHGWGQRLGFVPKRYTDQPCLWLHAVSVGEVNSIRPLVDRLRSQLPFYEVMISTTTDTGFNRAASLFGRDRVFFFPFDFSFSVALALSRLRPTMVILVELELWPNLLIRARDLGIPVIIANGRITDHSVRRFRRLGPLCRYVFGLLDLVLAQDNSYRQRFAELGVPLHKIAETGSLKWDSAQTDTSASSTDDEQIIAQALGLDRDRAIVVAGSTAETLEEEVIIRAYQQLRRRFPDLQLVIAPRKPERFDQVARLVRSRGFNVVRRSQCPDGTARRTRSRQSSVAGGLVVLLDTIGELRRLYAMATIVIVGRTFVPLGGSDVMEIAALGKPMVIGPHVENFADAVAKLLAQSAAVQLDSAESLGSTIERLLADQPQLDAIGRRARDVVIDQQGATARTVRHICELLGWQYDETNRGAATPRLQDTIAPVRQNTCPAVPCDKE